jgi:hypothetical protein
MRALRFAEISVQRQAFVRRCQHIAFGEIRALVVTAGEPVFGETTEVLMDLKLDNEERPRPELALPDFALAQEVVRLFAKLDEIGNGTIKHIEIRAGLPRRIVVKA